jgi:hypothetical protein
MKKESTPGSNMMSTGCANIIDPHISALRGAASVTTKNGPRFVTMKPLHACESYQRNYQWATQKP